MRFIQERVSAGDFRPKLHSSSGRELCTANDVAIGLAHLALKVPEIFRAFERITDCGTIRWFLGRAYCLRPGHDEGHGWHSDAGDGRRLLGVSINLTERIYEGGSLEIRERAGRVCFAQTNTGPGDAFVFRIARGFEHRVRPGEGAIAKFALGGWFKSAPD